MNLDTSVYYVTSLKKLQTILGILTLTLLAWKPPSTEGFMMSCKFTDFDQNVKLIPVVLFKLRHFCQKSYFESFFSLILKPLQILMYFFQDEYATN